MRKWSRGSALTATRTAGVDWDLDSDPESYCGIQEARQQSGRRATRLWTGYVRHVGACGANTLLSLQERRAPLSKGLVGAGAEGTKREEGTGAPGCLSIGLSPGEHCYCPHCPKQGTEPQR